VFPVTFAFFVVQIRQKKIGVAYIGTDGNGIFQNLQAFFFGPAQIQGFRPFLQGGDKQGVVLVVLGKACDVGGAVGEL